VEPTEWQETAARLLKGPAQVGHGDHEADHLVPLIDHYRDQVLVDEADVFLDVVMLLPIGQGHRSVDLLVGFVEQFEELDRPALISSCS